MNISVETLQTVWEITNKMALPADLEGNALYRYTFQQIGWSSSMTQKVNAAIRITHTNDDEAWTQLERMILRSVGMPTDQDTYHLLYFVYPKTYTELGMKDRKQWHEIGKVIFDVQQDLFVKGAFSTSNECKAKALYLPIEHGRRVPIHRFFDAIAVYRFDGKKYTPVLLRTRTGGYGWKKWVNRDVETELSAILSDEIKQKMDCITKRFICE